MKILSYALPQERVWSKAFVPGTFWCGREHLEVGLMGLLGSLRALSRLAGNPLLLRLCWGLEEALQGRQLIPLYILQCP